MAWLYFRISFDGDPRALSMVAVHSGRSDRHDPLPHSRLKRQGQSCVRHLHGRHFFPNWRPHRPVLRIVQQDLPQVLRPMRHCREIGPGILFVARLADSLQMENEHGRARKFAQNGVGAVDGKSELERPFLVRVPRWVARPTEPREACKGRFCTI